MSSNWHVALVSLLVLLPAASESATWPMKQRDALNTGRADYEVPASRMNDTFFDVVRWQKPSPGSPLDGIFTSTSMVFFDGAGLGGRDVVAGGYHWPKGVQGMDRHTGALLWTGNPRGGESIGVNTPAFSPDGVTVYVTNDATQSTQFPAGHPFMAFATAVGPSAYRHNGANPVPDHLGPFSPKVAPDGRIFLRQWAERPYGATDTGTALTETWAAATATVAAFSEPALHLDGTALRVISGGADGALKAHDGTSGAELWSRSVSLVVEASVTIDPANGNIYVGAGTSSIHVVGLDKLGAPLWGNAAQLVFAHVEGQNNPQRAQSTGCLSHDGATYYFQTNSQQGDGRLFAINTADGSVKWSFVTGSLGWQMWSASPIVTPNGVIVIGNNDAGTYFAIRDDGDHATVLDTLTVEPDRRGETFARATATLSPDGTMYLPLRTTWVASNGDADQPTYGVANVFTAFDLTANATPTLAPPRDQSALALNASVEVTWRPLVVPASAFSHYAIYRSMTAFTSVAGMTAMATVPDLAAGRYLDATAMNGVSYHYAVTAVSSAGVEVTQVASVGPRTPRDETDLQVLTIDRTPRYPRYLPLYVERFITEPSGFGPYLFSAAHGLGGGQTAETQRWPSLGDPVTYTATIRNAGTNAWTGTLPIAWRVDGVLVDEAARDVTLAPRETATFQITLAWDGESHEVAFTMNPDDARAANNQRAIDTKSVAFLTFVDTSMVEKFREDTGFPAAVTDDFFDWLNHHVDRFNAMFGEAGTRKRVHYGILAELADGAQTPPIDTIAFAVFPLRFLGGDTTLRRGSGYYRADDDIDYGLLHEMGHQLGLIDLYRLNLEPWQNAVSGTWYRTAPELMASVSPFLGPNSALAMEHWLDVAHGYFGQYLYGLPSEVRVRFLDGAGLPACSAQVTLYQKATRPGVGDVLTTQVKAAGVTDASGTWVLPNVPIDPALVPETFAGDRLADNPFGYVDVVGRNGLLLFKVQRQTAPAVTAFSINAGAANTTSQVVTLNNTATGCPTEYQASESSTFGGATWQPYSSAPSFTLSPGNTTKRVYFRVRNSSVVDFAWLDIAEVNTAYRLGHTATATFERRVGAGVPLASRATSDTIRVTAAVPAVISLAINGGATSTTSAVVTLNNTATGDAAEYQASESSTFAGAAWHAYATAPSFTLSVGLGVKRVYFRVRNAAGAVSTAKSDTITLGAAVSVVAIAINGGATSTTNPVVTLNNTATGNPTEYQASESSIFSGVPWHPYSPAPSFTLSVGAGVKRVYFRVRDADGAVSMTRSDTISLVQP